MIMLLVISGRILEVGILLFAISSKGKTATALNHVLEIILHL